ncbi:MAG: DUF4091 domain-containing protein [Planctomycetia bacterium]|nr:DUF4091 domain-containing protein [Planctomycetia bacterium]
MKKGMFLLLLIFWSGVVLAEKVDLMQDAWKLNGHAGRRLESADGVTGPVLEVTGDGTYSNAWILSGVSVKELREASGLGLLRFKVRRTAGSGGGMTGMEFANFDIPVTEDWKTITQIFRIPEGTDVSSIRLGQWRASGTLQFAEVALAHVVPTEGLSSEEVTDGAEYVFRSQFGRNMSNYSRPLERAQCGFNTDRWCFGGKSALIYRFTAKKCGGEKFYGGTLEYTVGYFVKGTLAAEYSLDGETWESLAVLEKSGTVTASLPEWTEGVAEFRIRFRLLDGGNLQMNRVSLTGKLGGEATVVRRGTTYFWELVEGDSGFPYPNGVSMKAPGDQTDTLTVTWEDGGVEKKAVIRCTYYVPDYYREDYGYRLSDDLWWCEATHKVALKRRVPKEADGVLRLSAAGNDYESLQIVLCPEKDTVLKSAKITGLPNAELRRVYYHFVEHPTDRTGVVAFWPDALVPLEMPWKCQAGKNQPLWLTVYVPEGTPAGTTRGTVTLVTECDGVEQTREIPVELRVWGFTLPKENHVATAFGYSAGTAYRYHGVKEASDREKINDAYLRLMSQYRISPYDPTPTVGLPISFVVDREKPENSRAVIDFSQFDPATEAAFTKYHFTHMNLWLPGMGGGTFHSRTEPSIQGFGETTPEYQAMFSSMVRQLEAHFREKGWLDKVYVYWFDEPEAKDYAFVRNGMNRIKKYAPGIRTMLTEEPSKEVIEGELLGKVDIWCPVTPNFNEEMAKKCREKGERFWWYVCCWPHAPYCTEFIDHSAVELRTWLWQSWKYDVVGVLIWTSNYWTSGAAFPDGAQDPYRDPMCYVSGYSTPPGTKRFWGNGDGRLYYPPLSCAQPSETPNFDAPVPSLRLAMLREGIEDYEMLYLLEERLKNATPQQRAKYASLLVVPESVTKSMTEFSTLPRPIYEHRAKVAEAIEALK